MIRVIRMGRVVLRDFIVVPDSSENLENSFTQRFVQDQIDEWSVA